MSRNNQEALSLPAGTSGNEVALAIISSVRERSLSSGDGRDCAIATIRYLSALLRAGAEGLANDRIYQSALDWSAARVAIDVLQQRGLGVGALSGFARFTGGDTSAALNEMFEGIKAAAQLIGNSDRDFAKFYVFICSNSSLTNDDRLFGAIELLRNPQADVGAAATVPSSASVTGAGELEDCLFISIESKEGRDQGLWAQYRKYFAWLEMLVRIHPTLSALLLEALRDYCVPAGVSRRSSHQVVSEVARTILKYHSGRLSDSDFLDELQIEERLRAIFTEQSTAHELTFRLHLFEGAFIKEIKSLSIVSSYIESKPNSERREILKSLLVRPLHEAFESAGYPVDHRDAMTERIVDALLSHDTVVEAHVPKTAQSESAVNGLSLRDTLPKVAPAIWKSEKLPDETPPDFVKRHYGQWLRADATGLTRPDIRRLDSSLYIALGNWLRSNTLPSDCPLPTKGDAIAREDSRFAALGLSEEEARRGFWRWRARAEGKAERE